MENVHYRLRTPQPWAFSNTNGSKDFVKQNSTFVFIVKKKMLMPTYGVERRENEGLNVHTGMAAVKPCFRVYILHFFHPPYSCKARLFASLSG